MKREQISNNLMASINGHAESELMCLRSHRTDLFIEPVEADALLDYLWRWREERRMYKGWRVLVEPQVSRRFPFVALCTRLEGKGRDAKTTGFNVEGRTAEEAERKARERIDKTEVTT